MRKTCAIWTAFTKSEMSLFVPPRKQLSSKLVLVEYASIIHKALSSWMFIVLHTSHTEVLTGYGPITVLLSLLNTFLCVGPVSCEHLRLLCLILVDGNVALPTRIAILISCQFHVSPNAATVHVGLAPDEYIVSYTLSCRRKPRQENGHIVQVSCPTRAFQELWSS